MKVRIKEDLIDAYYSSANYTKGKIYTAYKNSKTGRYVVRSNNDYIEIEVKDIFDIVQDTVSRGGKLI